MQYWSCRVESWSPSPTWTQCSHASIRQSWWQALPPTYRWIEPKTCGEMGSLPERLDTAAVCRVYPAVWFQFFRIVPGVFAGVGWGSPSSHHSAVHSLCNPLYIALWPLLALCWVAWLSPHLCVRCVGRQGCYSTALGKSAFPMISAPWLGSLPLLSSS